MDWLTFISKLVEALAWPSIVVVVLLFLRKELPSIVRSLRKLKFKDVEMEFGEAVKALAAETKRAVPQSKKDFTMMGQSAESVAARLLDLSDLSPRAAILEAWLQVEAAAADYLHKQQRLHLTAYLDLFGYLMVFVKQKCLRRRKKWPLNICAASVMKRYTHPTLNSHQRQCQTILSRPLPWLRIWKTWRKLILASPQQHRK